MSSMTAPQASPVTQGQASQTYYNIMRFVTDDFGNIVAVKIDNRFGVAWVGRQKWWKA